MISPISPQGWCVLVMHHRRMQPGLRSSSPTPHEPPIYALKPTKLPNTRPWWCMRATRRHRGARLALEQRRYVEVLLVSREGATAAAEAAIASFGWGKAAVFVYSPHRRSPSATVVGRRQIDPSEEKVEGGGSKG